MHYCGRDGVVAGTGSWLPDLAPIFRTSGREEEIGEVIQLVRLAFVVVVVDAVDHLPDLKLYLRVEQPRDLGFETSNDPNDRFWTLKFCYSN